MKIAVITGRGFEAFGGIETYIKEVYGRLAENGHQITVYSRRGKESLSYNRNIENIRVPYIKLYHLDIFSSCVISTIHAWLKKVDVICYHGSPAALASFLPLNHRIKKIVIFHGLDWVSPILNKFLKSCIRLSEIVGSRYSDRLITISEYLRQYFMTNYRIDSVCITPGADRYELRFPQKILKWNLEKERYVLFLGRLTPEKGCHLLIQTYRSLNTEIKLVIAGPAAFSFNDAYYRYLRQSSKNDPRIIFTGSVNGDVKKELLSNAYIVAYPSLIGGLPLTVLEAMGYGKCTLVSAVCDYYEVIKTCSILFKTGDKEDLHAKLQSLIQDPVKCEEHGRIAQDYIAANFSWKDTALKFENVFNEVCNNGNKRSF